MRTYLIILSDITSEVADNKFTSFVEKNKFDYWRYMPLNWILATPDNISTNDLVNEVLNAYGMIFQCVLEININDVGGVFPAYNPKEPNWSPFLWFQKIKDVNHVPRWIREAEDKKP